MPQRLAITIRGAVQGVGFRPFIYRLASELRLSGWVTNSLQGVFVQVEGPEPELRDFLLRLESEKPPRSFIQSLESRWLDAKGFAGFEIRPSQTTGSRTALVLPDIATCPDCRREILDPADRRYFYPFTNCTHCGPRFSIIEALPYDRVCFELRRRFGLRRCCAAFGARLIPGYRGATASRSRPDPKSGRALPHFKTLRGSNVVPNKTPLCARPRTACEARPYPDQCLPRPPPEGGPPRFLNPAGEPLTPCGGERRFWLFPDQDSPLAAVWPLFFSPGPISLRVGGGGITPAFFGTRFRARPRSGRLGRPRIAAGDFSDRPR